MREPKPASARSPARLLADERGLTIAELLVGAAIAMVVLGVGFGTVAVQGRSAAMQTGLADAQNTGRGAGEILLQDLRMAGFGMLGVDPEDAVPPIEFGVLGGETTLTLRGAFTNTQTTLKVGAPKNATSVVVNPPPAGTAFVAGELVLVDSGLSSEIKTITGVSTVGGDLTINLDSPLQHQYPVGPNVIQLEEVVYTWENDLLLRNGQVVADAATTFDLDFVAQDATVADEPGENLRSVVLDLVAEHPSPLPDTPTPDSHVTTEVNVRNLTFRFDLS
ncbi:MAG: hypothetical protein FJ144_01510 [Deltaproteobacteria bacterium]|nr:hypothetical protein [Deltaproteobacteria bacterium]